MEYAGQFAWMRFFCIAPLTELQGIKTNNDINVDMIKYVLAFKCADSNSHIADVTAERLRLPVAIGKPAIIFCRN